MDSVPHNAGSLPANHPNPNMGNSDSRQNTTSMIPSTSVKKTAFVQKLYIMLSDPKLAHLIWWSRKEDDCVFALHPGAEFANVLTNYFKHGNVSSFVRQLHMYGFHKVFDAGNDMNSIKQGINDDNSYNGNKSKLSSSDDLIWEFRHSTGYFRKGDESGLSLIKRRSSNKVVPEDEIRSVSPGSSRMGYYHNPVPQAYPLVHQQPHPDDLYSRQIVTARPEVQYQYEQRPSSPQHTIPPYFEHSQNHYFVQQHQQQHYPLLSPSPPPLGQAPMGYHPQDVNFQFHQQRQQQQQQQQQHVLSHPQSQQQQAQPPFQSQDPTTVHHATNEIAQQQRSLSAQSDYLHKEIRSTISDVLKFSDHIPKIVPALKNPDANQYEEHLNKIQQNFITRAENYKRSPLSNDTRRDLPQSQPTSVPGLVNPFVAGVQQRQQTIQFWEGSSQVGRQGSFLVDPLNPTPRANSSLSGVSSSRSSLASQSSGHYVPSSETLQAPSQPQRSLSTTSPKSVRSDPKSSSLPHLYQSQAMKASSSNKRNEPLNTYLSQMQTSGNPSPTSSSYRQNPPRSVPEDYNSKSSIPNINHLTLQLRPSVVEMHNPNNSVPGGNNSNINSFSSSASTRHSTLYSAHSSISSISSRNSYGSFSGFLGNSSSDPHNHSQKQQKDYSKLYPHPVRQQSSVDPIARVSTPPTISSANASQIQYGSRPVIREEGLTRNTTSATIGDLISKRTELDQKEQELHNRKDIGSTNSTSVNDDDREQGQTSSISIPSDTSTIRPNADEPLKTISSKALSQQPSIVSVSSLLTSPSDANQQNKRDKIRRIDDNDDDDDDRMDDDDEYKEEVDIKKGIQEVRNARNSKRMKSVSSLIR